MAVERPPQLHRQAGGRASTRRGRSRGGSLAPPRRHRLVRRPPRFDGARGDCVRRPVCASAVVTFGGAPRRHRCHSVGWECPACVACWAAQGRCWRHCGCLRDHAAHHQHPSRRAIAAGGPRGPTTTTATPAPPMTPACSPARAVMATPSRGPPRSPAPRLRAGAPPPRRCARGGGAVAPCSRTPSAAASTTVGRAQRQRLCEHRSANDGGLPRSAGAATAGS